MADDRTPNSCVSVSLLNEAPTKTTERIRLRVISLRVRSFVFDLSRNTDVDVDNTTTSRYCHSAFICIFQHFTRPNTFRMQVWCLADDDASFDLSLSLKWWPVINNVLWWVHSIGRKHRNTHTFCLQTIFFFVRSSFQFFFCHFSTNPR